MCKSVTRHDNFIKHLIYTCALPVTMLAVNATQKATAKVLDSSLAIVG